MVTALFLLLALVSAGLFTEIIAASRAPYGYEDEAGFHFGAEPGTSTTVELENPS